MSDKIKQLSDLDAQTLNGKTAIEIGVPVGTVITLSTENVPEGFLECNGAEISRTTYSRLFDVIGETYGAGDGSTTFNLPDLRGEFIRGWDNGRGVDSGRTFASWQADELKEHTHISYQYIDNDDGGSTTSCENGNGHHDWNYGRTTSATGGPETRPRNIALMFVIKY